MTDVEMWATQSSFRMSLETTINEALRLIGFPSAAAVCVFGVRTDEGGGLGVALDSSPDDRYDVAALAVVSEQAAQLLAQDPDRAIRHSHPVAQRFLEHRLADRSER